MKNIIVTVKNYKIEKPAERIFFAIISILFVISILLALFAPIKPDNKIKIIYDILPAEMSGKISLISEDDIYEQQGEPDDESYRLFEITYFLGNKGIQVDNIAFELQYGAKESYIKAIEIYNHNMAVKRFAPTEIVEYFKVGENESYYFDGPFLVIATEDESPTLIGNERLQSELQNIFSGTKAIRGNLFFYSMLWYGIACVVYLKRKSIIACLRCFLVVVKKVMSYFHKFVQWGYSHKYYIGVGLLIIVEAGIFLMAAKSKIYAHIDEHTTKMAIDYYLGRWLKPSLSGSWVAGTFSHYGISRLKEPTWYYLAAGKFGWIITFLTPFTTYYRMLNVFLFGIMVAMTIKHGRQEKWMFFVLLFTPQLWYLFSYATSDAWDLFWGFVITFELIHDESCMNKYFTGKKCNKFLAVAWCGFLFSNIFLGKRNYYAILLFAFIILLFRILPIQKEKIKLVLPRYLWVLAATFAWYKLKIGLDRIGLYMEEAGVIIGSQREESSATAFAASVSFAERFQNVFSERNMLSDLFGTFTGVYCWAVIWSPIIYRFIIAGLYVILIILLIYYVNKCNIHDKIEIALMFGAMLISIGAVGWWCMYKEYQPQGRYILPIILVLAYISTKRKEIYQSRAFQTVLLLIGVVSLYSFYFVALKGMVSPYLDSVKIFKRIF